MRSCLFAAWSNGVASPDGESFELFIVDEALLRRWTDRPEQVEGAFTETEDNGDPPAAQGVLVLPAKPMCPGRLTALTGT